MLYSFKELIEMQDGAPVEFRTLTEDSVTRPLKSEQCMPLELKEGLDAL